MINDNELKKLILEHNKGYQRWEYLYKYGGQDPFWSDGCNMGLVRNHIIYYKNAVKEVCEENKLELPKEYYIPIPKEVDNNYMARENEIITNANKTLEVYNQNKDYLYLVNSLPKLSEKARQSLSIYNVIGYVAGLNEAIKKYDLISMRRHENYNHYLESFKNCAEKVRNSLENVSEFIENEQLSFF